MIKLDPEEEADDDENPSAKTPQKTLMPPPNTSQAYPNEVTLNHQHMNNVQINLPRVNLPMAVEPPQNFVSLRRDSCKLNSKANFTFQEKSINVNSIPKPSQRPAKAKTPSKKSSSSSAKKKKRRKLSSSEEEESDFDDDDDY